jgi:hypothetical protein
MVRRKEEFNLLNIVFKELELVILVLVDIYKVRELLSLNDCSVVVLRVMNAKQKFRSWVLPLFILN